ncbi:MAG: fibronectin type III domain-containing protein [Weeksellaceae bacterium]|nr:fibronectin type III domain-containing protein [Weeksellaceae bacterium]
MKKLYTQKSLRKKWVTTFGRMMLMLMFSMTSIGLTAQVWTINYCSSLPSVTQSNLYGPMYSVATANATSRTASIYPSTQLAGIAAQQLTAIYFHTGAGNASGMVGTPNLKIYLKEVTPDQWGTTALDWATETTGATLVYDGNPAAAIGTGGGWKEFVFNSTFTYTGTQNLAVLTEYTNPVASNAITWSYEYTAPCMPATTGTTTKYTNNTTGTLPASLSTSNTRKAYIGFDFVVSCPAPTNVTVSGVTQTGAQFNWTAGGTETSWEYVVQPAGAGIPTAGTQTSATSLTLTTQLTANTNYEFYVRSNCGGTNGDSVWKGPYTFTTLCGIVTSMFENFDSYPTGSIVPNCWARIVPATTPGSQTISSAAPASGTRNIYQYASATTTPVIVVLPQFSNINAGTHWLRFKAKVSTTGGAMEVGYVTDPADAATFTVISTLLMDNTTYTAPDAEKTVIIPSTVPANARLAIRNSSDAKSYYWDDVYWEAVPTCFVPEFITVSTVTSNTADISWTSPTSAPANGYDVYYNTTGVAPDATTVLDATNSVSVGAGVTAATITSLTPATTYYMWVRSKCGAADMSAWAPAPVLVTACVAFTVPYAENFDTTSTGTTTNNNAPTCWTYYEAPGSTGYGYVYGTAANVLSPPNSYYLYRASTTTGEMMLISPATTALSDGTNRVRFSAKSTNSGTLQVGTMNNAANPAGFAVLQTFTLTNTFEEYTVDFPVGSATYFAFNNASAAAGNVYLDDIFVEDIPSCVKPTNVTVTNITQSGATLNWTATVTLPATYDIYLSTSNTPPTALTTPTFSQVSGTSASLGTPPLTPSTTYYVWVRSYCNAGDQSVWTAPVSFTTLCSAFAAPFSESFSSGSLPNCWTNANPTTTSTSANAFWQFSGAPGYGTTNNGKPVGTYAWVDASVPYVGEHAVQLVTPQINLAGLANPYVRFEWFKNHLTSATGTLPAYDNNKLLVHVTTDGTTWTQIFADDTNSSTWRVVGIPLSAAYVGATIQVRFTVDKDVAGNGYFYDDVLLDEIAVLQDPGLSTNDVIADAKEISIYPNPFTDVVNISDAKDLKSVTVVDMSGRMVKSIANPGRQINLGELSAGLYILKLDYKDGNVKTVKAIKK